MNRISLPIGVNTEPAGAEVSVKGYATPDAPWEQIGVTPLSTRIPYALMRWRITKPGYEPFEGAPFSGTAIGALAQGLVLDSVGSLPAGMVRIPTGTLIALPGARPQGELPAVEVESFFLDRYEVTNREFRAFVDAGGIMPYELSQRPLFDLLGAPDDKKRHARLAGGHIPPRRVEIIREVLDWFDQHLGPVNRVAR